MTIPWLAIICRKSQSCNRSGRPLHFRRRATALGSEELEIFWGFARAGVQNEGRLAKAGAMRIREKGREGRPTPNCGDRITVRVHSIDLDSCSGRIECTVT